jgi:enamine deaminase RidA (YjgF/YER057c/UK114 family)
MTGTIDTRLNELGITLPEAAAPVASYKAYVMSGNLLYISGQLPFVDGALVTGKLGEHHDVDTGYSAAQACGIGLIAQMKAALGGDLDRVEKVVKLGGFVACTPDFTDQPKVINGTSDLMQKVFGEKGEHARSAVGVPALPLDAAVEVDAIIAITS